MARTNNLTNFLTDVADAIKTKKGDSTPILASDFDTEIENLPSGGGGTTPSNVTELNNTIIQMRNAFSSYLLTVPGTYETGTTDAVTLYTPDVNCQYYGIQKRSNGKYRAFWTIHPVAVITNSGVYRPAWGYSGNTDVNSNLYITDVTIAFYITNSTATSSTNQFYYSGEKTTIDAVIDGLKNNTLTYTAYTGSGLGISADTPYVIPYSNITYIDVRSGNDNVLLPSRKISSNETISN